MKKNEIQIGGTYRAKVNGKLTTVRVDDINESDGRPSSGIGRKATPKATRYQVTNLTTGRPTTFRSAQKFLSEVVTGNGKVTQKDDDLPAISGDLINDFKSEKSVKAVTNGKLPAFKHTPSDEQLAILEAVQQGHKVLVIEAGAGCAKTTTLEMIAQIMKGTGQYTAFNSSLVAESKSKFEGTKVAANTTHSLAFRSEGKRFSHRLGGNRMRSDQLAEMLGVEEMRINDGSANGKRLSPGFLASQVMGAIKRFCQSADVEIDGSHFRYLDGIDKPTEDGQRTYDNNERVRDYLLPFATRAWNDIKDPEGQLPFSHDNYVKVWQMNNPVIAADNIMLDEAQDTAPVMLDVLKQQVVNGTPLILVGDSCQSIYSWRGAIDAMASFPDAPRLMLSQSFRFGQAIADVANAIIETLDEPTTLRLKGFDKINSKVEAIENPTAILCRTNAVAVASLLGAIADGKKPYLIGGGSDVISFVEAAIKLQNGQSTSHPDLACFDTWTEVQEYSKMEDGEDLRLMVKLIDGFGAQAIVDALKQMTTEKDADLVISTAHKSKGRQWETVKLASDFPTKSKCDDSDRRLIYVAATRAMLALDISECPFFTGKDSLNIQAIQEKYNNRQPNSILPQTPSVPPKSPDGFTWAKWENGWHVRGPIGKSGERVDVVRKDGSSQCKTLGKQVWDNGSAAIYQI